MKKVVYSITKLSRTECPKWKGVGYVTDEDLIIACLSSQGKPYIRVFEDVIRKCHNVIGSEDEFKGSYYEVREYQGSLYDTTYSIWFKYAN